MILHKKSTVSAYFLTNGIKLVIINNEELCSLVLPLSYPKGGRELEIKKLCRSFFSCILSCMTAASFLSETFFSKAQEAALYGISDNGGEDYYYIEPVDDDIPSYSEYYESYSSASRPEKEIIIRGADVKYTENGSFSTGSYGSDGDVRENVLIWENSGGEAAYDITVEESGIYCLNISYFPLLSNSSHIELSMKIDGKTPFSAASRLTLDRVWVNEKEITEDSRGNQLRPSQIQKPMWTSSDVGDSDGLFNDPLIFYLEKGTHEICFASERADLAIEYLKFFTPEKLPTYEEYSKDKELSGSRLIRLEGESACFKSSPSLYPVSDNSSSKLSPSDPVKVRYNAIGGDSWKKAMQSASWKISAEDIGNGGWFRIGIKAKQDQMRGFYSNRRIRLDGKVPCRELEQVKFFYSRSWELVTPQSDGGEDIFVYLEGGKDHLLTLECVPGEIGDSMRKLDDVTAELNDYYRRIVMITGPAPDKYTDYYVHEKIPELIDGFKNISTSLKTIQRDIESLSGSSGSEASALENMAVILDKCVKKPIRIPGYTKQIKDNITSLSAWMMQYRDQPLEIDYIELAEKEAELTDCHESLWEAFIFGLKSFFGSFFEDYSTLSDVKGEKAVEVWVALGRDQAQIVNEMVENEFIPEYDIPISVKLVTGGVVEAALAGKSPDVALFLGGEFPVNLAARGLLVDISQYPDIREVESRFQENAMTPYRWENGTYGIPISQSFPMMFYRTDILRELGFDSPPETWDELIDMLPAIQRNYMSVGLVLPNNDISPATEPGHTFAMLMLQNGLSYYNDDLTASTFDLPEAVKAFEDWTDLYTKYSFEQTYDPFSRFRTGEYPIVISEYSFYNQLSAAAPELKGTWDICPVPGTPDENGIVSHCANSTGNGAVIFNKVENKDNAWEFIKWFTEADTQTEFGIRSEGLMGIMGRFETANTEALTRLSWSEDELDRLFAQRSELVEIPILPSSYAVTRNIMNAFRETVNMHENPRDTLLWYDRDINDEIARKNKALYNGEE